MPAGRWTDLLSGATVEGPRWVEQRHDFMGLPLLVRPGALVPLGTDEARPDYDYAAGVTIAAYEPIDGTHASILGVVSAVLRRL